MTLNEFFRNNTIYEISTRFNIKQLNLALEPNNIKLIPYLSESNTYSVVSY